MVPAKIVVIAPITAITTVAYGANSNNGLVLANKNTPAVHECFM